METVGLTAERERLRSLWGAPGLTDADLRFVADALVMLDEGAPSYGGWRHELAIPLPTGYDYDFANLEALRESRVERGVILHQNGMRYRLLMLPGTGRATPALMREVLRLAEAGATLAAPRDFRRAHGMTPDEEVAGLWDKITATGRAVVGESFEGVENKLGLEYPYNRLNLVEVPIHFHSYRRLWSVAQETVQPQMVLLPEKGAPLERVDFRRISQGMEERRSRSNETSSPADDQSSVFSNMIRSIFVQNSGFFRFRHDDDENPFAFSPSYNIFPNYLTFTNDIESLKAWIAGRIAR